MSDVYDIWLYPLQDLWRTVNEMSDFMPTGQMGNFIFRPVYIVCESHYINHNLINQDKHCGPPSTTKRLQGNDSTLISHGELSHYHQFVSMQMLLELFLVYDKYAKLAMMLE